MCGVNLSGRRLGARRVFILGVAAIAAVPGFSKAASQWVGPSGTPTAPTTGNWNTAGDWSPSGIPSSSSTTELDFTDGAGGYTSTDDISGVFQLNKLVLKSNNSTIAAASTNSLSLAGTSPTISQTGAGTFTVSAPIALGSGSGVQQVNGGVINLSGNLSGSALYVSNSSGSGNSILKLTGANTFNGLTINPYATVAAGLSSNTNTLGGGTITLAGGHLLLQGQQAAAVQQTISVTGFNQDVIVESGTAANAISTVTTGTIDGTGDLYQSGFNSSVLHYGLNSTGLYASEYNPSVNFQFAPYTGANDLQFVRSGQNGAGGKHPNSIASGTGTLTLATAEPFSTIQILETSQGAAGALYTVTFNFSDGSTETGTITGQDWYYGGTQTHLAVGGKTTSGSGKNYIGMTTASTGADEGIPIGMYEDDFTLSDPTANLVSVSVTPQNYAAFTGTGNSFNVFAVSGVELASSNTPTQTYSNNVSVTADSNIDVSGSLAAVMGNLTIGSNKLSITSSDTTLGAYSLTLGSASITGNATFNVASSSGGGAGTLFLGALSDAGSPNTITINPSGSGAVTLGTAAGSLSAGTVINVEGGSLNSNNATALGSIATIVTSGSGTFNVGVSQTISGLNGTSGSVALKGSLLTIGSTDNLSSSYGGTISGAGTLVKAGTGSLTLSGPNTITGTVVNSNGMNVTTGLVINNGTVVIAGDTGDTSGPIGTLPVMLNPTGGSTVAANLYLDNTPGRTLPNSVIIDSANNGQPTLGGLNTSGTTTFAGNVTLGTGTTGDFGHNLSVGASAGGEVDFTGNILANGGSTHSSVTVSNLSGTGSAIVKFTGSNTYAGGTIVNPNVTLVAGPSLSPTVLGSGPIKLTGGNLALRGQLPQGFQTTVGLNQGDFNADTILDQNATSGQYSSDGTPTNTIDGGSLYYENGYAGTSSNGLPNGGLATSHTTGHQFQFEPYTDENTLQFTTGETGAADALTLHLTTPTPFQTMDFLSTGQGNCSYKVILNLDGVAQPLVLGTVSTPDWYQGPNANTAINNLNPLQQGTGNVLNYGGALAIFENDLNVPTADQQYLVDSITFQPISVPSASLDIYAVSGMTAASTTPLTSQTYNNDINITSDANIDISGSLTATAGNLSIGSNTLSVTSSDASGNPYSLSLQYVTFNGTTPTFDVENNGSTGTLYLGTLDDQGAVQNITKSGTGTLVLTQDATSLVNGTIINVIGGTLESDSGNATGGFAVINLAYATTFSIGADQQIGALADYDAAPIVNGSTVALNGHTLTIGNITDVTSTFSGSIVDGSASGGGITKTGAGTLTLLGHSSYTGATNVTLGTLALGGDISSSSNINVTNGATVKLLPHAPVTGINDNGWINPSALNLAVGTKLDVTTNTVVFDTSITNHDPATLVGALANGYDAGNWDGLNGPNASDPIILTSSAAAIPGTTLGYAVNGPDYGSGTFEIMFTWYGDLNLDGVVNSEDDTAMKNGDGTSWSQGDLNYDGQKNADDFSLYLYGAAVQTGNISNAVPEPGLLGFGLALPLLGARRRRK